MQAWIRYFGFACLGTLVFACGSKGDADPATGGSGGGTAATGGTSGGGTGGATGGTSGGGTGGAGTGGGGTGGSTQTCRTMPSGDETETVTFDTADVICTTACTNLQGVWKVAYTSADAANGRTPIPPEMITVAHNATDGDPDPGAFQVDIPYTSAGQYVGVGINFAAPQDFTNKVITARVKVTGLGDPTELMTNPGGTKIYVKSGTGYVYAAGAFTNVGDAAHPLDTWITVPFDLRPTSSSTTGCFSYIDEMNEAGTFDPTQVLELGLQFDTGGMQPTVAPATVLIDSISY